LFFVSCFSFYSGLTSPYRLTRLQTLTNSSDSESSYHSDQIILSLSSGGFFGKGFANSDQKYRFSFQKFLLTHLAIIGKKWDF
jgi:cell division protein FtsW (lipid II flippase)